MEGDPDSKRWGEAMQVEASEVNRKAAAMLSDLGPRLVVRV